MDTYIVGDEVVLQKNKEGFIRFKGKIPGKTGTFYGIELTQGTGKHSGDYDGVHYFDCAEGPTNPKSTNDGNPNTHRGLGILWALSLS